MVVFTQKKSVKVHLRQQGRVFARMAERVDLPASFGSSTWAERGVEPFVTLKHDSKVEIRLGLIRVQLTDRKIIDDVLVVGAGFVVHAPAATGEFELALSEVWNLS